MSGMYSRDQQLYAFGPFVLDPKEHRLLRNGESVGLSPKLFHLLLVLVRNHGRLVERETLTSELWPNAFVGGGTLTRYVSELREVLGNSTYIETVPKVGYRFLAPVSLTRCGEEFGEPSVPATEASGDAPLAATDSGVFGGHGIHATLAGAVYAGLYAEGLFLEVAYRFDELGGVAWRWAVPVWLWIFGASLGALALARTLTRRGAGAAGLLLAGLGFVVSAGVLHLALGFVLPDTPVTEASIAAMPAHAAYLKNVVLYYLPAGLVFLILPLHCIWALDRGMEPELRALLSGRAWGIAPRGAIYLRPAVYGALLLFAVVASLILTAHLLDSLRPGKHLNLFVQLVYLRAALYFGLAGGCLAWYSVRIQDMRRRVSPAGVGAPTGRWLPFARTHLLPAVLVLGAATGVSVLIGRSGAREQPAAARVEGGTLVVSGASGRELWRHTFDAPFELSERDLNRRTIFHDLDQDGSVETLFTLHFRQAKGSELYCFAANGRVRWRYRPAKSVRDKERKLNPPYVIVGTLVVPGSGKRPPLVAVASVHHLSHPTQLAVLDAHGKSAGEYWHHGHLKYLAAADLDGDGRQELIAGGVNDDDAVNRASLLVFDPARGAGGSTGTDGVPHFPGKAAGTEIAAVYFPRTAVSKFEEFNRVQNLRVVGQRLMVVVAEGISEDASPGVVYELGFDLSPAAVTLTDNVKVRYREMVQRGLLPKGP